MEKYSVISLAVQAHAFEDGGGVLNGIHGFMVFDLNSNPFNEKVSSYSTGSLIGAWINTIAPDSEGSLIWIGTDRGPFAFDESFNEIFSCVLVGKNLKSLENKIEKTKCYKAKYEAVLRDVQAYRLLREDPELKDEFKKMEEEEEKKDLKKTMVRKLVSS